jgi:NADPH2:quinone reductase
LLVHGAAGGTGSPAVQLGKELGARVIAVVRGVEKAALCREDGADHVVDSGASPDGTGWPPFSKRRVRRA